jgi:DNA primase
LALPLLAPERTLKLISLPAGVDPDSLVRAEGPRVFGGMLEGARPLADCLFDLLREGASDATPEQRAAFRTRLDEAARKIPDRDLADEYRRELKRRFFESQRRERRGITVSRAGAGRLAFNQPAAWTGPRPQTNATAIAAERARILTAILVRHPTLFRDVEHAYAGLELTTPLARLRDAISEWAEHAEVLDSRALMDHLHQFGLHNEVERTLAGTPIPLPACASPTVMPAEAEEGWWHIFGFLNVDRLHEEVKLARQDAARGLTGETERRLVALMSALNKVSAGEPDGAGVTA